jgi:hypothetical protein
VRMWSLHVTLLLRGLEYAAWLTWELAGCVAGVAGVVAQGSVVTGLSRRSDSFCLSRRLSPLPLKGRGCRGVGW